MSPEKKAEGIVRFMRGAVPADQSYGYGLAVSDMLRHLREGGLTVIATKRIHRIGAQKAVSRLDFERFGGDPEWHAYVVRSHLAHLAGLELLKTIPAETIDEPDEPAVRFKAHFDILLPRDE